MRISLTKMGFKTFCLLIVCILLPLENLSAEQNKTFVILQTNCSKDASINRILKRTKENYESNALTEQAYINNVKKFEKVDLDDLKNLYPELSIVHLTVDTELDSPDEWFITGMDKK